MYVYLLILIYEWLKTNSIDVIQRLRWKVVSTHFFIYIYKIKYVGSLLSTAMTNLVLLIRDTWKWIWFKLYVSYFIIISKISYHLKIFKNPFLDTSLFWLIHPYPLSDTSISSLMYPNFLSLSDTSYIPHLCIWVSSNISGISVMYLKFIIF